MESTIKRNAWLIGLKGLLLLSFGLFVFLHPNATIMAVTYVIGLVLFFSGLTLLMAAFDNGDTTKSKNTLIIEGLIDVILGFSLFVIPLFFAEFIVMLLGAWMIFTAVLKSWYSYVANNRSLSWSVIDIKTTLTFAGGLYLLLSPLFGFVVLSCILGFAASSMGLILLYHAYQEVRPLSK